MTYDYNNPEKLEIISAEEKKTDGDVERIIHFKYNGEGYIYSYYSNRMLGAIVISGKDAVYSTRNPQNDTDLGRYLKLCISKQKIEFGVKSYA